MENAYKPFDIIRVIAMTGIVVDHYFQASGIPVLVNTGLQMGGVFLMVFFALSAYLFGMKWAMGVYEPFTTWGFLKKRCLRIYIPLWLILPAVIFIEWLLKHSINVPTIIMNIVGLGWFKPFILAGHLWYITLMMFLYLVFLFFSKFRLDKLHMGCWLAGYVALTVLYVFGETYFSTFSAVAPVITVFFASLLFYKRDELMGCCRRWSSILLMVTVFSLALSWWMYVQGWHFTHKAIATFSSFSAGFALFMCLQTFIEATKESRMIKHFSDISYEVYLVHLPLLPLTTYVSKQFGFDSRFVMIPVWLLLTWLFAIVVHKATQRLTIMINNK